MIRIYQNVIDWLGIETTGKEFGSAINRTLDRHRLLELHYRAGILQIFNRSEVLTLAEFLRRRPPRLTADQEWDYISEAAKTLPQNSDTIAFGAKLVSLDTLGRIILIGSIERLMVEGTA